MERRKRYPIYIAVSAIVAMFIMAVYFYPFMPARIVTHFNSRGIPDGFMGKFLGVFLLPFVSLLLLVFFNVIPRIDPLGKNIKEFRYYYDMFISLFMLFMFYIEFAIILWNLGVRLNVIRFMSVPVGLLYVYLGVLLLKSKRNWFIGIRTPWTMTDDRVWEKTNKLAGVLFVLDGVLVMLSFIIGRFMLFFIIWFLLGIVFVATVYSYVLWRRLRVEEEKR